MQGAGGQHLRDAVGHMAGLCRDKKCLLLGGKLGWLRKRVGRDQCDPADRLRVATKDLDRDIATQPVTQNRKTARQDRSGLGHYLFHRVGKSGGQHDDRPRGPKLDDLRHEAARIRHEPGNQDEGLGHKGSRFVART